MISSIVGLVPPVSARDRVAALVVIGLLATLTGCASGQKSAEGRATVAESFHSGFLDDYSRLQPVENEPGTLLWINPDVDAARYKTFIVDPVVLKISPELAETGRPDPGNAAKITDYFRKAIKRELGKTLTVTEAPGEGVARIQAAITGAQVERQSLSATDAIPVKLVLTGVGEAANLRDKVAVVFFEAQALDSLTGENLAETVQSGIARVAGDTSTDSLSADQVRFILDSWAQKFADRVARLRAK